MNPSGGAQYFMGFTVTNHSILALFANILLTAIVIHYASKLVGVIPGQLGVETNKLALFFLTCFAINGIRVGLQYEFYYFNLAHQVLQLGWFKFLIIYASPFVLLWIFLHYSERRFIQVGTGVLLLLSPLPLILGRQFIIRHSDSAPLLPRPNTLRERPKGMVLLMIFDEWDYNWTFPYRPKRLHLPEIDRFAGEYLFFNNVYAPTNETYRSIPSLLSGGIVVSAESTAGPDMLLKFRGDEQRILWSNVQDLPYTFGNQGLSTCFITHFSSFGPDYLRARPNLTFIRKPYFQEWEDGKRRYQTFASSLLRQWMCLLENLPGFNYLINHSSKEKSVPIVYKHALRNTVEAIRSQKFDLIIVHWPIPHSPVIIDPATGALTDNPTKGLRLIENIALVDSTIGQIRLELESLNLWETATIILTSDHWQRLSSDPKQGLPPIEHGIEASQHRVPLLIKWPGAQKVGTIDTPLNAAGIARFLSVPESSRRINDLDCFDNPIGVYSPWIK